MTDGLAVRHVRLLHEGLGGHRKDYLSSLSELLEDAGVNVSASPLAFTQVVDKGVLLSTMLEDHAFKFAVIALIRLLIGRSSVALLFRPKEALQKRRVRSILKRITLRLLRKSKRVKILTIVPLEVDEAFSMIADGWIYDPHLWDLTDDELSGGINQQVLDAAGGRKVVSAIGTQNKNKGFDQFCRLWLSSSRVREQFLFVAAGRVAEDCKALAEEFVRSGGVLNDCLISDEYMLDLYRTSDMIWCCYSPEYDQASGIFGRAAQIGPVPIVREESYIEKIASLLDIPVVVLPWEISVAESALCSNLHAIGSQVDRSALRLSSGLTLRRVCAPD